MSYLKIIGWIIIAIVSLAILIYCVMYILVLKQRKDYKFEKKIHYSSEMIDVVWQHDLGIITTKEKEKLLKFIYKTNKSQIDAKQKEHEAWLIENNKGPSFTQDIYGRWIEPSRIYDEEEFLKRPIPMNDLMIKTIQKLNIKNKESQEL